ncbi:MAG: peptidoglycan DD-metalloendopeptidase family protein [Clostridia bacterium]|nr:peptidoglycan DD-metalloendopeptidase family protein [Clostridia bacterium]
MKDRRSFLIKLTSVILVVISFVFIISSPLNYTNTVSAATDSKVKGYEDKIAQLKKDQKVYEQQIKDAKANAASYKEQKEILDKQINALSEEIELSNALLIEYNNAIVAKEEAITSKQGELDEKFGNFKNRLRTSYEEGVMGYLTMLFSSKTLSGFLTSIERMTNMLNYDKRVMKQMNDEKASLSKEKASLEQIKASQQEVHDGLQKTEAEIEAKANEMQKFYDDTLKNQKKAEQMLAQAEKDRKKAEQELDKYLEELAKKNSGYYDGGAFSYPLPSNQNILTSKHGTRTYQMWGKWVTDYHRGIDIACPTGTPVYAGADGKVEISGWNVSYGYYVVISHGSGYTTLYAHNSSLLVKVGQTVKRGQQIAKSGSTGNSSGPHLHFEISINGVLQDPLKSGLLSHPQFIDRS